jgi:hypothetical protein
MTELLNQQEEIKQRGFSEAMRYMENAKDTLKKSRKEDNHYEDKNMYARRCCCHASEAWAIQRIAQPFRLSVPLTA